MNTPSPILAIEGIHIDGFGPFHDLGLAFGRGLTIVEGPNEAGKSALLQFLLYGLLPDKADKGAVALAGGRLGGRILVAAGDRRVTVERHGLEPATLIEDGRRVDVPGAVPALLGGVDRALFAKVYAFSAVELLDLNGLGDDKARARLFAGAVAGAGRSVEAALNSLRARREQLWRPRGVARIGELDRAESALRTRLVEALARVDAMGDVRRQLHDLRLRLEQLEDQWSMLVAEQTRLDAARRAWPVRVELKRAEARLAALVASGVPSGDEHATATAGLQQQGALAAEVERERQALAELLREQETTPFDSALVAQAQVARAVHADAAEAVRAADEVARLGPQLAQLERKLDAHADAVGLGPDGAAMRKVHAGPTFVDALRKAAVAVDHAERKAPLLAEAEATLARAEHQRDARRAALQALPAPTAALGAVALPDGLPERVVALRAARSAVGRRDSVATPPEGAMRLAFVLVLLGIIAGASIVASALVAVGLLVGLMLVGLGVVVAIVARKQVSQARATRAAAIGPIVAAGFKADVDAAQVLDALDAALDTQRRAEVAAAAGGSRELGERARLQAEVAEAERAAADARVQVDRLRAEMAQLESAGAAWKKALADAGLPSHLPAGGCEALLHELTLGRETIHALDAARTAIAAANEQLTTWIGPARALLQSLGRPAPDDTRTTAQLVGALAGSLDTHERLAHAARERAERIVLLQQRLAQQEARLLDLGQKLDALRAAAEKAGATLPIWLERLEEQRHLEKAIADGHLRLQQMLGGQAMAADVVALLDAGDPTALEAAFEAARARRLECERTREQLLDTRGRLRERLQEVETDATLAELEQQLADLAAERERCVRELAELMVAEELLRRAIATFRTRHEPGVFRVASEHLARATDGAWTGVTASDDQSELWVTDRHGSARESALLSRGTRDLLYIALRLGLAHEQRPGGLLLPLVLDDVLINLDPERAAGLARILAAEAAKRQVLVLTCRPETTQLLREHAAGPTVISLARWAGASGPFAARNQAAASGPRAETTSTTHDGSTSKRRTTRRA
jgi:uncharacterized protein YhaN